MQEPSTKTDASTSRLTIRQITRDLAERFFSLERGWLRTVRELTTEPGALINRYIRGDRRSYANPFGYLLVGVAFSITVQKLIGFEEWAFQEHVASLGDSPSQQALARDMIELVLQYMLYVSIGLLAFSVAVVSSVLVYVLLFLSPAYADLDDWNLVSATQSGNPELVQMLLDQGAPVDFQVRSSALHAAAELGHLEVAEILLEHGARVDATDHLGRSPLHIAVRKRHGEIARFLLENGADVNAQAREGKETTALMLAAACDETALVKLLLRAGADPSIVNPSGKPAADLTESQEIRELLRSISTHQSDTESADPSGVNSPRPEPTEAGPDESGL